MINNNPQKNDLEKKATTTKEQTNISRHIIEFSQRSPYQKAILCLSGRDANGKMSYSHLTYRQLNQQSDDIARGLQRAGVVRGTKTALQIQPGIQWFAVTYALLKIGAVPVIIQPSLGYRHMAQCIKAVEPEALITSPKFSMIQLLYPSNYQSVHLQINTDRRWLQKGLSLVDLLQNEPGPFQIADVQRQDLGMILFSTSNESDEPKPIILTHKDLNAILLLIRSVMGISENSVFLSTFPFFMMIAPAMGIGQVIPSSQSLKALKIDPRMIIESIWDHGITHLLMSPTHLMVLENFLKDAGIFLSPIQRILSWGEAFPAEELQKLHYYINNETQVFPIYGMAEAPMITTLGSHEIVSETQIKTERGFGICQGKIVKDMEMQVIDVNDRPIDNWSDDLKVEGGNIGELVVRGEAVSNKYSNNVKADALTKIPDGKNMWHRTGDVGWVDTKGYFWFCGRKKDRIIISEEETLYTIPCEAVFMRHQRVHRCIIVGVGPIPYQTPVLIIELAPGDSGKYISTLTHELIDLAQAYPHTGNIKKILFRKRFPVHPLFQQKINRKQLTIWAAKKLGKCIPDEAPDPLTEESDKTTFTAALDESDEMALSEPMISNNESPSTPSSMDDSERPSDDESYGFETETIDTYDEDLVPAKEPLMKRMKTAFYTMKEKTKAVVNKNNSDSGAIDSHDDMDEDIYYSTDITAEHQIAGSQPNETDDFQSQDMPDSFQTQDIPEPPPKTILTTDPNMTQLPQSETQSIHSNEMVKEQST